MSRTTKHTKRSVMEIFGQEREINIVFSYTPGAPATGPTYASGGEPGYGPEIEILKVSVLTSKKGVPEVWAEADWLADIVQDSIDNGGPDSDEFTQERADYEIGIEESRADRREE